MSTKCSLSYGDNFHLYSDCFDDENIYLELNNAEFETSKDRIVLTIPLEIWEVIRGKTSVKLDLADKTDVQIEEEARTFVANRLLSIEQHPKNAIMKLAGFLSYGSADAPVEEQVATGIAYLTEERRKQQELKEKINECKRQSK